MQQPTEFKVTRLQGTPVFAAFSRDLRFSKVFGATRFPRDPLWYYPAFYPVYRLVLRDFKVLQIPLELSETAKAFVAALDRYEEHIRKRQLPEGFKFKTKPFDHQLVGLVHILYNFRAALFYSCGLGKTKIIVDWQRAIQARPLILCPKVVLKVWSFEMQRHGIDQEVLIIDAKSRPEKLRQIDETKNYPGVVISYDSARRYVEELMQVPYNAIVADESHFLKGYNSKRTEAALELSRKASRRVIMSGTPSTGDPRDMWSQFRFLGPCFFSEPFWTFKQTYCVTASYNKHVVVGYKNLDVLNRRVNLVAHRRTKEECLDLPRRRIIDVPIHLSSAQQRVYNSLINSDTYDKIRTALDKDSLFSEKGLIDIPHAAILVNKLIQVGCGFLYVKPDEPVPCDTCEHMRNCVVEGIQPFTVHCLVDSTPRPALVRRLAENAKLDVLVHKLDEILVEPSHKCIVWGQFCAELDWIEEALKDRWMRAKQNYTLVRVDGRTGSSALKVNRFNTDPNCRVYLGQVDTGVGITLNAANYMIYFSLPWKLLAYDQSLDRNHRVGQERDVIVFRLLARGTIDTHVARALSLKRTVSETLVATLQCARCSRQQACAERNISLFEPGCKYKQHIKRPVAQLRNL